MRIVLTLGLFIVGSFARKGFGPTEQEWGYVTVRPGAHMFWWLHQTSAPVSNYTQRPLFIWFQGGPGASSTGFGNFGEIGPWFIDSQPRQTTWIKDVNVLFVDNPVGTGFSYVDSNEALTTTNRQIAEDFLVLLKGFYEAVPELLDTPLYIFSESYGGKMTIEIALVLDQAIKKGDIKINLKGVGLGDSWISPIDSTLTWAPYLLHVGAVDQQGYERVQRQAEESKKAIDKDQYDVAFTFWGRTQEEVSAATNHIDFYNILSPVTRGTFMNRNEEMAYPETYTRLRRSIDDIMNTEVKQALGLSVTFGAQSGSVFDALTGDFMKAVTHIVEQVLNETDIKVAVYNGQLDLIVDTPGTVNWVDNLRFKGSSSWNETKRNPIYVEDELKGYSKKLGNLGMYWVNRAGHMVPAENPAVMEYILREISNNFEA